MKDEHVATLRAREETEEPDTAQVLDYLRRHPDFFLVHEEILAELELPHRSGSAVSLVERQVALLRERNIDSRHRLNRLLETAQDNDRLFAKTQQLILALLEARSLSQLSAGIVDSVRREFGADFCNLILIGDENAPAVPGCTQVTREAVNGALKGLLRHGKPVIGPLRPRENEVLFGADAEQVHSAALLTLGDAQPFALLAIGSTDGKRFHAEMGTLFIDFIAAILERLIPRLSAPAAG